MSKSVTVFVNDRTLPESGVNVSVADDLRAGFIDFTDIGVGKKFFTYACEILTFHRKPVVGRVNTIISTDAEMFTEPNYDNAEGLLEQIYEEKKTKIRANLIKQRDEALKSQVVYSDPALLAFAHAVVTTYPDMITGIENSVYIDRAFKFISGSYLFMLERAMNPPTANLQYRKEESMSDFTIALNNWRIGCARTTLILLAQYGVTGDEKYLQIMDKWPLYSKVKTHRVLVQIVNEAVSKVASEMKDAANDVSTENGKTDDDSWEMKLIGCPVLSRASNMIKQLITDQVKASSRFKNVFSSQGDSNKKMDYLKSKYLKMTDLSVDI
jgi:hypothetical protein